MTGPAQLRGPRVATGQCWVDPAPPTTTVMVLGLPAKGGLHSYCIVNLQSGWSPVMLAHQHGQWIYGRYELELELARRGCRYIGQARITAEPDLDSIPG